MTWSIAADASSARSASAIRARSIRWQVACCLFASAPPPGWARTLPGTIKRIGLLSRSAWGPTPTIARVRSRVQTGKHRWKPVTVTSSEQAVEQMLGPRSEDAPGVFGHQRLTARNPTRPPAKAISSLAPRDIEVYSANVIAVRPGVGATSRVGCQFRVSKGTYIPRSWRAI